MAGSAPANGVVWEVNSNTCGVCQSKFGTFKRRHHCRACGHLVCGACSKTNLQLDQAITRQGRVEKPSKPVRVCKLCVAARGGPPPAFVEAKEEDDDFEEIGRIMYRLTFNQETLAQGDKLRADNHAACGEQKELSEVDAVQAREWAVLRKQVEAEVQRCEGELMVWLRLNSKPGGTVETKTWTGILEQSGADPSDMTDLIEAIAYSRETIEEGDRRRKENAAACGTNPELQAVDKKQALEWKTLRETLLDDARLLEAELSHFLKPRGKPPHARSYTQFIEDHAATK